MNPIAWNITTSEYSNCHSYLKTLFPLENKVLRDVQLVLIILFGLVSTFGVVSNCIVAYLLGTKIKKSPLTILLFGLSISDIIGCVFDIFAITLPFLLIHCFDISDSIRSVWNFKIITVAVHFMVRLCNVFYTAAICLLRLMVIVWPIKSRFVITNSRVTIVAISIWPLSALICLPPAIKSLQWLLREKGECNVEGIDRIYVVFVTVVSGVPVTVVLTCTGCMIYTLFRSRSDVIEKSGHNNFEKTTLMLVIIATLTLVNVSLASFSYSPLRDKFSWLRLPISTLFACINSSVNFIVYAAFGKTFRESARKLFCKRSTMPKVQQKKVEGVSDSSGLSEF